MNGRYKHYKLNRKLIKFKQLIGEVEGNPLHVAIIVPYRDREKDLRRFLKHFEGTLFDIYVIEQITEGKFNKGVLLNLGFMIASKVKKYKRFIFHDVDSYPDKAMLKLYSAGLTKTVHFASPHLGYKYTFQNFLGGVIGMTQKDFEECNGYPNDFLGWGGEDDAMYNRLATINAHVYRPIEGSYDLHDHPPPTRNELNVNKQKNILDDIQNWKKNGLEQLIHIPMNVKQYPDLESFLHEQSTTPAPSPGNKVYFFKSNLNPTIPLEKEIFESLHNHYKEPDEKKVIASSKKWGLTPERTLAIYFNTARDVAIRHSAGITQRLHEIQAFYNQKKDLLQTAMRWRIPPYLLGVKLKGVSRAELEAVERVDVFSTPAVQRKSHESAEEFEKILEEILSIAGKTFQTQTDLVAEQREQHGRAIATPDFYFDPPLILHKRRLAWIDAKDYYGGDNYFTRRTIKKQLEKYAHLGDGLFVFRWGYNPVHKEHSMSYETFVESIFSP